MSIHFKIQSSFAAFDSAALTRFNSSNHPFLTAAFLAGLEEYGCLGERVGWFAKHIAAYDESDSLIAIMPCYEKHNSFGEFVFDWQWASAYERSGIAYYPKLVCSVPFSPVTGQRLLNEDNNAKYYAAFADFFKDYVQEQRYSSVHILFLTAAEKDHFAAQGFANRLGYQYHWQNKDYKDFDDFLSGFASKKRRNVKRERRLANDIDGLTIQQHYGNELSEQQWQTIYQCYRNTFHEKGNFPSLTLAFFQHLGKTLGQQVVIFTAEINKQIVAASICFKSDTTLYGRYWGCLQDYDCLHFELCFYRGIEFCIEQHLQTFEPGAQGEHKITRGFLPQETWSSHWIALEPFRNGINDFLEREKTIYKNQVYQQLNDLSPFKTQEN